MKAYEIFQNLNGDFAADIMGYFRKESREIYKTTIASLATQRKLRPVFVTKKPAPDQIAWLVKTLKMKMADTVGEHLLQVYLLKEQKELLIEFCDAMGIEHDDDGGVEELPEEIDAEKLKSAVDQLLEKHSAQAVTLYLRVFQLQRVCEMRHQFLAAFFRARTLFEFAAGRSIFSLQCGHSRLRTDDSGQLFQNRFGSTECESGCGQSWVCGADRAEVSTSDQKEIFVIPRSLIGVDDRVAW